MSVDQTIDYEGLALDAMRGLVRTILKRVHKHGLPGNHHFYIEFYTQAPGVSVSTRLKQKYPEKMTIVMQHRFWGLQVFDDRFEIKLTFDSIPECLVVPYAAIKVFFDPSVPYGFQFEESETKGELSGFAQDQIERSAGMSDLSLVPDASTSPPDEHQPSHLSPAERTDRPLTAKAPPIPKRPRRKTSVKTQADQELGGSDQTRSIPGRPAAGQSGGASGSTEDEFDIGSATTADEATPLLTPKQSENAGNEDKVEDDKTKILSQLFRQDDTDADTETDTNDASDQADDDAASADTNEQADASAKVVSLDAFRKK